MIEETDKKCKNDIRHRERDERGGWVTKRERKYKETHKERDREINERKGIVAIKFKRNGVESFIIQGLPGREKSHVVVVVVAALSCSSCSSSSSSK